MIDLHIGRNFEELSKATLQSTADVADSKIKVNVSPTGDGSEGEGGTGGIDVGSLKNGGTLATLHQHDNGERLHVYSGIIATNRFIDKNDNAVEAVRLVRTVAKPGSRLVFLEAAFGNGSEPGVLETLGSWALAGWWQLLLLGGVVIYTLGKPFGYPDEERPMQRGGRELIDAVSNIYRRSRMTQLALHAMYDEADRQVRRKLKLPVDAPVSERNRLIPTDLATAFTNIENVMGYTNTEPGMRIPQHMALEMGKSLNHGLATFLGQHVPSTRRNKHR